MRALRPIAITHSGGSSEPDMKAFAVMQYTRPSRTADTTVMPEAKRPMTLLNNRGSIAACFAFASVISARAGRDS